MGRVLGLDFGTKRVGAALSDPRGLIATPLEVYERRDRARDARHYQELVRAHEVEQIVVGLPLHVSGKEGELVALSRDWGHWLAEVTALAVVFHDERYTSLDAEEVLRDAGVRHPKRVGKRDMIAAQILLQHYLDSATPGADAPNEKGPEP